MVPPRLHEVRKLLRSFHTRLSSPELRSGSSATLQRAVVDVDRLCVRCQRGGS